MEILTKIKKVESIKTMETDGYGIAVDLGTTTIVMYLYNLGDGSFRAVAARPNYQAAAGADVITRIQYCIEHEAGLEKLHTMVVNELSEMMDEVCMQAGIGKDRLSAAVIVGNTTMMHLLCSLSPVSMGKLPFQPLSKFGETISMCSLGSCFPEIPCYLAPCFSAFVGGDISAALVAVGMQDTNEICMLLDIGTNGEIALGNGAFVYTTSTAAGPAFEGAHIACGMSGVTGAVSGVTLLDNKLSLEVIGDGEAKGICGSGLLDAIACFRTLGLIDETGRIIETMSPYMARNEGETCLRLSEKVFITQQDIREVQMAKAAIAAGTLALLKSAKMKPEDISCVYIAGGFGNYMKVKSAQQIGLLPQKLGGIVSAGNAAGSGAVMALLDNCYQEQMEHICRIGRHIELGHNPYFMEKYVEGMYL
ncbi:MAG: ASKHA domain-containing protein [Christensenella sp.]|nr:ASKHA domain-containing protein [Christensenella sp.]